MIDPFQISESERRSYDLIDRVERANRRDGRIITIVSFLLCVPLGWLISRLAP